MTGLNWIPPAPRRWMNQAADWNAGYRTGLRCRDQNPVPWWRVFRWLAWESGYLAAMGRSTKVERPAS